MAMRGERQPRNGIDFLVILCLALMGLANFFQIVGVGSNHWVDTVSETYGTVGFSGLWQICTEFGTIDACRGFTWEDVQVSHWFRTVQTMEVLGMVFGIVALLMVCLYHFVDTCKTNIKLPLISMMLLGLSFVLTLSAGSIIGALKDVQKAIALDADSTTYMSWSFGFSIVGCILYLASAIAVFISR